MSLRYRILLAVTSITVAVFIAVMVVVLFELVQIRREFEEFDRDLRQETMSWIWSKRNEFWGNDPSPFLRFEFVRNIIHVKLPVDGDGDLLPPGSDEKPQFRYEKPGEDVDLDRVEALVRRALMHDRQVIEGNAFAIPRPVWATRKQGPGGVWVKLDIPNFGPHEPLQKVYIVMLAGVVVIILVIYYVFSRGVIRPIERLDRAAHRVARGDYTRPVPLSGREDELELLSETFNSMMVELGNFRQHLEERVEESRSKARDVEKSLVTAQRLAATGKLASGIAHEVNNPLGGMLNAARRLLRDPPPPAKQEEYLKLIIDGLLRVEATVKKILQFTPHKVAPQPVFIERVIRRALALASHRIEKEGTEAVVDLPADAQVFGDPFELQQVFLNILINALDAIQEAGTKGEITVRGSLEPPDLKIELMDNGCGIPEDDVSQAFDLFFTTKEVGEGTGLGLSIAHNVIQNHGGRIRIAGRPGGGTIVEITLPLIDEED